MLKSRKWLFILNVLAISLFCTGCCTKTGQQKAVRKFSPNPVSTQKRPDVTTGDGTGIGIIETAERKLPEREKDRRTQELYKRLELSFEMFQKNNLDGSLREVERVQMDINDDPYLDMQTWYLSAMIYHKTGKTSRRTRAMRKMLESMETLQKDPRFRESFEDGMMSQQVIDMALSKGEGRYVE